jgi:hypothetical protein
MASNPPIVADHPYDPATLTSPLPNDVRNTLIVWLAALSKRLGRNDEPVSWFQKRSDKELITRYKQVLAGAAGHDTISLPGGGTTTLPALPNPIASVTDFLALLAKGQTWIRVAEFAVGIVLVGVGINAALKGAPASAAGKIPKPKPKPKITLPPKMAADLISTGRHAK